MSRSIIIQLPEKEFHEFKEKHKTSSIYFSSDKKNNSNKNFIYIIETIAKFANQNDKYKWNPRVQ